MKVFSKLFRRKKEPAPNIVGSYNHINKLYQDFVSFQFYHAHIQNRDTKRSQEDEFMTKAEFGLHSLREMIKLSMDDTLRMEIIKQIAGDKNVK